MARVDFINNKADMAVAVMGSLGFSTAFIMAKTGLTIGQVLYRLGRGGIRRVDFRNGGGMAKYVLGVAAEQAEMQVVKRVSDNGKRLKFSKV